MGKQRQERLPILLLSVLLLISPVLVAMASPAGEPSVPDQEHQRKVLDIERTRVWTRIITAFHDMLRAAGHPEWSPARLQGVLGNAFSFEMRHGGGSVWQEGNLDWWLFFETRPESGMGVRIRRFQTRQGDALDDIRRTKAAAWEAVRTSIDNGVPAAAWCPMSAAERAARDWGLLVGYDEAHETYVVRRRGGEFDVRHDEIGFPQPREEFLVLVYEGDETAVTDEIHVAALQNAIRFAEGTRYDTAAAPIEVDARGLAAYELWREALATGTPPSPEQRHPRSQGALSDTQDHADYLRRLRGYAAAYLRELVDIFPVAEPELRNAAAHYDDVVAAVDKLQALCTRARDTGELDAAARAEAAALVSAALEAETEAIGSIKAVLARLEAQQ